MYLINKKEHTRHKIQYIREYVRQWLFAACNRENDNINFIDCMSNAGIIWTANYVQQLKALISFVMSPKAILKSNLMYCLMI